MKKSFSILEILIFAISLILLLAAYVMNIDNAGLLIGIILIIVLGIMQTQIPKFTDLSNDNPKVKTLRRMNVICVIFLVLFNILPLFKNMDFMKGIPYQFILIIAIMVVSGNVAPKLPHNRHIGLRLPWTTHDENTWKAANKLLGYLTFPIVLAMVILYFIFDNKDLILLIGILSWIGIPAVYSLIYYKNMHK
ncbi:SdpI family protein [Extibacter muris]|uniref:SdpI family protein n=1 Tax=Extibacter muris TaxID=1796622 RepID=UPI001D05CA51|nr:SdpI family protein [Extibacter muris]MCB6202679.1 SdpI family protein [Extibacter muris]MCQ4664525.1 SdpI family protein [Extibacter muris]MCQ4693734.1 SdpI family protein [Extibacter muris]